MTLPPDYLSNTLQLIFIVSIPQAIIGLWFSFVCLGFFPERFARRIVICGILHAVYIDIPYFLIPPWIHIFNVLLSIYVLISLIFPELKPKIKLLVILFLMLLSTVFEMIYGLIAQFFGGYDTVLNQIVAFKLLLFWPGFAIIALATGIMHWKKIHIAQQIRRFIIHVRSMPYFMLLLLVAVQIFLFMTISSHIFIKPLQLITMQVIVILSIMLFIYMTIKIMRIIASARIEGIYQSQDTYINDLTRMFASIRGQRHDFANHVQVMYSMLALKKYDQLRTYMEEVVKEIQSMNVAVVELPSPALAALVQAKAAIAMEKKIRFDYLVHTASLTFSAVTSIDLVRIIGNLVDNAFDEVSKLPESEREVHLEMYIHNSDLYITVANTGKQLTDEEIEQMFNPGYTTKADGHTGLGLANVLERVHSYNGHVSVDSDIDRGVVFTIRIPNSKLAKSKLA
ncbi:Sensor histidine kinase RcsC [Paenibacillus plantiphilus]|uniref:histidine kinase n=1 Tax=Paenibacillus plantiphilus TaxID=2905650 RepID=A0ABM9CPB8_9BACL|nr:ATP-binding protein [Paenibacillus plantiphilus]CAH1219320.1 Sensor histidine kinase RcsC [Paenibacillus plantiphilus]